MYEPPIVRGNDWWPAELVAKWAELRSKVPRPPIPNDLTEGARRILRASAQQAADPFMGTVERRVIPDGMTILDIEERAARDAIARAKIDPAEIDLLLTHSIVADHQLANPACPLHERLGLSPACLALETEATAYTSLAQLALAEASIVAGRARCALLVQSSVATRLIEKEEPNSVLLGDGATAIVVGPVPAGRGILSSVHFTEGKYPASLIMSVPGGRWYDDGAVRMHIGDPGQLFAAHLRIADTCAEAVGAVLQRTGHQLGDVDFLCVFQGTPWLQRAIYEQLGVTHLQPFEVFQRFGYLSSAMIPAALFMAEQARLLADNDLVIIVGGGTGMTYGATTLRWTTP
jgi:3-oxoacyl-[acyl-carrier-protein] synthase-3